MHAQLINGQWLRKGFKMVHRCWAQTIILCSAVLLFGLHSLVFAQFFETRGTWPVVAHPEFVATGDFNGDGKPDMVLAAFITNDLMVFLGKGDGTFRTGTSYPVGAEPWSVAVADFNDDGLLDLAVADYGSSSIGILLGNGDGTFQPENESTLSIAPTVMAAGDFNGDRNVDLATVDAGSSCFCVSILLGNGDGSFQAPISVRPPVTPSSLGVGDFNHDGKLDVATAGQFLATSKLTVYLGNGDGTLKQGSSYLVEGSPESIAVGDFRNIGKLDLAVADLEGVGVSVLLGNGDGSFQQAVAYPTLFAHAVSTGDFNRDANLDFVTANFGYSGGAAGATVFLGNGDGTFQDGVLYPAGQEDWSVAVADFNQDGKPDLALADCVGDSGIVLLNTGVVSLSPTTPLQFATQVLNTTSSPQTVTLTNTGPTTLSISFISVQGKQFQLSSNSTCSSSVAPGASCNIAVVFEPKTKGQQSGLVSISDSASKKPQAISLSGAGTVVSLSPGELDFPPTRVGSKSAPQTIDLINTGSAALNITTLKLAGRWPGNYSKTSTCGTQVAAGASCSITVTFVPLGTGQRNASVSITDDGGGSPQTVTLIGTGT